MKCVVEEIILFVFWLGLTLPLLRGKPMLLLPRGAQGFHYARSALNGSDLFHQPCCLPLTQIPPHLEAMETFLACGP